MNTKELRAHLDRLLRGEPRDKDGYMQEEVITQLVCFGVAHASLLGLKHLEEARGGLQYLNVEQFAAYTEALRALDQLFDLVSSPYAKAKDAATAKEPKAPSHDEGNTTC